MIKSIHFQNFKVLRDATLALGPFTLIVGPNGSGKSTAMQALRFFVDPRLFSYDEVATVGFESQPKPRVDISIKWESDGGEVTTMSGRQASGDVVAPVNVRNTRAPLDPFVKFLKGFRVFSFEASAIAAPVQTQPKVELQANGSDLAAVLDALSDSDPERFEHLNEELRRWLPEFDRILFETPRAGFKGFLLRTRVGHHRYRAVDLSHGTLFSVAFLTLAYLPSTPSIVCFEEPDHGIHPRLLIDIKDAMYRLAFPEDYGEKRPPVQVIATTHSPYLLDLYKEHPEQIVIATKDERGAHFERLSDKPHISELLEGAPLGDIWFSGILGGVPANP